MKEAAEVRGYVCQLWEMLNFPKRKPQTVLSWQMEDLADFRGRELKPGNLWGLEGIVGGRFFPHPLQGTQAHTQPWEKNNGPYNT